MDIVSKAQDQRLELSFNLHKNYSQQYWCIEHNINLLKEKSKTQAKKKKKRHYQTITPETLS